MFSVMIKSNCEGQSQDVLIPASQVNFLDNPLPAGGGFAGGVLIVHHQKGDQSTEYRHGTAYVMNDRGKTVATYHLSE